MTKNNLESFRSALACDPISAYGGIVSCNFRITRSLAIELNKIFLVKGIKSKKPNVSVKKPGMIRSKAAKAIEAPDIIS